MGGIININSFYVDEDNLVWLTQVVLMFIGESLKNCNGIDSTLLRTLLLFFKYFIMLSDNTLNFKLWDNVWLVTTYNKVSRKWLTGALSLSGKCTGMSKAYLPFQLSIMLESRWKYIVLYTDWFKTRAFKTIKTFFYEILAVVTILPHLSTIKFMHILPKTKNIIQYCFFSFPFFI